MKTVPRRFLTVLFCCLIVIPAIHFAAAQRRGPLTVTRIYTGPDGQAHAEEIELKLTTRANNQLQDESEMWKAVGARFVRAAPGFSDDWHNPSHRQYLITISGRGEIEVAGGQKVLMAPGRILLMDDTTGKGHRTRTVGDEPRVSINVPVE